MRRQVWVDMVNYGFRIFVVDCTGSTLPLIDTYNYNRDASLIACEVAPLERRNRKSDSKPHREDERPRYGHLLPLTKAVCRDKSESRFAVSVILSRLEKPCSHIVHVLPLLSQAGENHFEVVLLNRGLLARTRERWVAADIRLSAFVLEVDLRLV